MTVRENTPTRLEVDLANGGVTGTAPVAPPVRRRRRIGSVGARVEIAVLVGPALIVFLGFVIFPVVMAAYYGFFSWQGYGPPTDFVGFRNYITIIQDPTFQEALTHNGVIVVLSLADPASLAGCGNLHCDWPVSLVWSVHCVVSCRCRADFCRFFVGFHRHQTEFGRDHAAPPSSFGNRTRL
jgi:hypothetical protein